MAEIELVRVDARNLGSERICSRSRRRAGFFAQCFRVSGSAAGKGLGSRLLDAAEADARKAATKP